MTLHLDLPDEIYCSLREMAGAEDVWVERLAGAALRDQVEQWNRVQSIARRPVSREQFPAVLDSAPDCEPAAEDRVDAARP